MSYYNISEWSHGCFWRKNCSWESSSQMILVFLLSETYDLRLILMNVIFSYVFSSEFSWEVLGQEHNAIVKDSVSRVYQSVDIQISP